ncbi:MAG: ammonia-forming cytochrome c nitrite reductase subunit c552 [Bdellovibrionaceae bacterium]|nr:ammonia-forming cytochrome c nitrite reductase subunit c552 [Pseudobdellovibrionaceae bacterium]
MKSILKRKRFVGAAIISAVLFSFFVFLATDIAKKKEEAKTAYPHIAEITDDTEDSAIWGINFPLQYESYLKTVDQVRTKYGGSEAVPRTPSGKDPRSTVAQSRLEEDPRLKEMWAGYAFSIDFREERGHAHMLLDQIHTQRQDVVKQPGTCINCHASTYVPMKKLGNGDIFAGFEKLNQMPYFDAAKHTAHPVSCIDCHTPVSMKLRVTRPAFIEGIKVAKESQGIKEYDINKMASHQEMRTYVCAQCHVEYYFKGPEKRLTFPWKNGLKADQIYSYYKDVGHKDWVHKITGAPVLKAQHPEFEMYSQGIHARSGVSCTDCHMPYQRVGASKFTDHHVQSPMLNIAKACQTCHRWPETEMKARVEQIQDRTFEMRDVSLTALTQFIKELGEKKSEIKDPKQLDSILEHQRKAQFLLDFVEAENSMGFHAPGESLRLLGLSLDSTLKGQKELSKATSKK